MQGITLGLVHCQLCNGLSMGTEGQTRSHLDSQQSLLLLLPAPCLPHMSTHDHDDQLQRKYMLLSGRNISTKTDKYGTDNQTNIRQIFNRVCYCSCPCNVFLSCQLTIMRRKYMFLSDRYHANKQTNTKQTNIKMPNRQKEKYQRKSQQRLLLLQPAMSSSHVNSRS